VFSKIRKTIRYRKVQLQIRFHNWRCNRLMTDRTKRLETAHIGWMSLRTGISGNDTALTDSTKEYSDVPSHKYDVPRGMNSIELRVLASIASIGATIKIYAARKLGDIALVCSLAVTTGTQETTIDGVTYYYVDTIVVTSSWMKDIKTADIAGNNGMSRAGFDIMGYDEVFALLSGYGSGTWRVDITGF